MKECECGCEIEDGENCPMCNPTEEMIAADRSMAEFENEQELKNAWQHGKKYVLGMKNAQKR